MALADRQLGPYRAVVGTGVGEDDAGEGSHGAAHEDVVDLTVEDRPISVCGVHMSHLLYGSPRNFAELRHRLRTEARPDAAVAGDMNSWGPLVRLFMRGWKRAVIGRSWPAWRPHSQIDHILVRGALRPHAGAVLPDAGSDHRPIRAELEVR